jgi:HlyD family secretion protein
MKRVAITIVLVLALASLGTWWLLRRSAASEEDGLDASGTVEATEARLGFDVAGRLAEVLAREGDEVAAGQLLARLASAETEARRDQAAAQLAAARALLAELRAGSRSEEIGQAAAAVEAARVRRANAASELARSERLFAGGAISREAFDRAALADEVASAELERSEEQLRLLERGTRAERVAAQQAQVALAEAALAAAEAALGKLSLAAPFAGRVTVRHLEPGEIVAPGTPVVTLLDAADRWVRIYVPENRIGAVALGARCGIVSDTYPGKEYAGEVVFIASEAEFTPKSVQTQEERVRLVYAVKVRVLADPGYELKPGMPVDVTLPLAARQATAGPPASAGRGPE